jgi:hypothetical protein
MSESDDRKPPVSLGVASLFELTQPAVLRTQQTVEFAGFLTREEDEAIYVADAQGTWVLRRDDVVFLDDWRQAQCAPEFMAKGGRPVRVGVREGATIYEIRPWLIRRQPVLGVEIRQEVEKVFTLGGSPLPIGEQTTLGEKQMAELERMFARRLGWDPDICNDPRANVRANMRAAGSKTIVLYDGF